MLFTPEGVGLVWVGAGFRMSFTIYAAALPAPQMVFIAPDAIFVRELAMFDVCPRRELDVFFAEFTMFTAALFAVSRTVFETDAAASVVDFATEAVVFRMLLVIGTALLVMD